MSAMIRHTMIDCVDPYELGRFWPVATAGCR